MKKKLHIFISAILDELKAQVASYVDDLPGICTSKVAWQPMFLSHSYNLYELYHHYTHIILLTKGKWYDHNIFFVTIGEGQDEESLEYY